MVALWGIDYHLVDPDTLTHPTILVHFLDSPVSEIRRVTLAGSRHASLVNLSFDLCARIAPLLRYPAIVTHFAEHLDSPVSVIRRVACRMLGTLAGSRHASLANLSFNLCVRIAPLLRYVKSFPLQHNSFSSGSDVDIEVRRSAVHALLELSYWRGGSQALEAQIAERVPELLTSSDKDTVRSTCEMLGNLGYHSRKLDAELCECMSALLGCVS
jgi:hypothetical protein